MPLKIYNTATRSIESFKPLRQDSVKVYYCGPTPYNYAHIGNLRSYLFEDIVIRTLRFLGYKVQTVMNVTDIDDKTIRDSQKSGKTLKEFTEFYTAEFLKDLDRLGIVRADTIAPISGLITEMQTMIQGLLDKDFAYISDDGSIYYRVEKFKNYGKLANLDIKGMISSVRINNDEYEKDQIADFALWKAYNPEVDGDNFWEISLKIPHKSRESYDTTNLALHHTENAESLDHITIKGRPGWHIECSACNYKFFGDQIDIHMGGIDNLFPHHQNEVAQTEAFTGKTFAKYWIHGGHLLVDNKKMSKSAGNFYTLRDIIEQFSHHDERSICRAMRLMNLQNRYRENFNFTFERLQSAINTLQGFDELIKRIGRYEQQHLPASDERFTHGKRKFHTISRPFREDQQYFMQQFVEKLEDDFDTVSVMTVVFEFQSHINSGIDTDKFSYDEIRSVIDLLISWNEVLNIFDFTLLTTHTSIPHEITALAIARIEAKQAKNWDEADKIRSELQQRGWNMIDEKAGGWHLEKRE